MEAPKVLYDTIQEGPLFLSPDPMGKSWKKLWFVLGRNAIRYYRRKQDLQELGQISLKGLQVLVLEPPSCNKRHSFSLSVEDQCCYLAAQNEAEMKQWIRSIADAIRGIAVVRRTDLRRIKANLPAGAAKGESVPNTTLLGGDSFETKFMALNRGEPTIEEEDLAQKTEKEATFTFTGERLLLSYRYMKGQLSEEDGFRSVCVPSEPIFRRFGFQVAIEKLQHNFRTIDRIVFTDSKFSGDFYFEFCEFLKSNEKISQLCFRNVKESTMVENLHEIMEHLPVHVTSLELINIIGRDGWDAMLDGLQQIREDGIQAKSKLMKVDQLRKFVLNGLPLKEPTLSRTILILGNVATLDLSNCSLGDEGAKTLLRLLSSSGSVQNLTLAKNGLTKASCDFIAQYILNDDSLVALDLHHNMLADGVAKVFLAISGVEQHLHTLNVARNKIPHHLIYAVAKLLQYNKSLRVLNIEHNQFREESGKILVVNFSASTTICEFKMDNKPKQRFKSRPSPVDLRAMQAVCERNKRAIKSTNHVSSSATRSVSNFREIYTNLLRSVLVLLNVDEDDLLATKESLEYTKCLLFVKQAYEHYDADFVDSFVNDRDLSIMVGVNGSLVKHIAYLVYLTTEVSKFKKKVSRFSTSYKQGYMFKRGGRRHNWKRRWFTLHGLFMYYYVSQDNKKRKGVIVLDRSSLIVSNRGLTPFSFELATSNRTYVLSCESELEMKSWMSAIQSVLESKKEQDNLVECNEIGKAISSFCTMYEEQMEELSDPHRTWVLQWWFPQCLEILALNYLFDHTDSDAKMYNSLNLFFLESTTMAVYLLLGEYLFDSDAVRIMACASSGNSYLYDIRDSMDMQSGRSGRPKSSLQKLRVQTMHRLAMDIFPTVNPAEFKEVLGKLEGKMKHFTISTDVGMTTNSLPSVLHSALTQSKELLPFLYPFLSEMNNTTMTSLLRMRKEVIVNPSDSTDGERHKFNFVPCEEMLVEMKNPIKYYTQLYGTDMDGVRSATVKHALKVSPLLSHFVVERRKFHKKGSDLDKLVRVLAQSTMDEPLTGDDSGLVDEASSDLIWGLFLAPPLNLVIPHFIQFKAICLWIGNHWPQGKHGEVLEASEQMYSLRLVFLLISIHKKIMNVDINLSHATRMLWHELGSAVRDMINQLSVCSGAGMANGNDAVQAILTLALKTMTNGLSALVVATADRLV